MICPGLTQHGLEDWSQYSDYYFSQVGAGTEPEPDGETDQDLVPEQEDEEQEEHSETGGQPGSQQQQRE